VQAHVRYPNVSLHRPRASCAQDLWHLHVHVFPRYDGDDLYGSGYREATYDERLAFAARLQAVL
jgi:diadenosine tetraphosphate (Ap4A) HIT family hydrolase